jgi:large subunit ribosomal protein L19e
MNLRNKKQLAARVLGIGVNRVIFDSSRLDEIKESLTRQDIKDLLKSRAVTIREARGKRKTIKRTTRRGEGKRKKIVGKRKKEYMILVRKLRKTLKNLKNAGTITNESYKALRKKVRAKAFKSRAYLMEAAVKK